MYMDLSYSKGQRIKSLNIIVSIIQNRIPGRTFISTSEYNVIKSTRDVCQCWLARSDIITLFTLQSVSRAYPSD